jgi:hypothetical protein
LWVDRERERGGGERERERERVRERERDSVIQNFSEEKEAIKSQFLLQFQGFL